MAAVKKRGDAPSLPCIPKGLEDHAVCGDDLLAEAEGEDVFLVSPLIGETDLVLLKGPEKLAFKTWVALFLAVSVILGCSWVGFRVERRAPRFVLFVSAETSRRNIARRLRAICKGLGVEVGKVAPYLVVLDEPITLIPVVERLRVAQRKFRDVALAGAKAVDASRAKQLRDSAQGLAEVEISSLGQNLHLLQAIEEADEGTWSLIILDTLRDCLQGDENSSADASRFMAAARALARKCECPVMSVHHTNKAGDESDARSSRGSTALTASPDVIISVDTTGLHPTLHFRCRNVATPAPVGFEVVATEDGGMKLEVREASAAKGKGSDGVTAEDVVAAFALSDVEALTVSSLRRLVSDVRGGKPGGKVSPNAVERHLLALEKSGAVSRAEITRAKGDPLPGWVLGKSGGEFPAVPVKKGARRNDQQDEENPFKHPRLRA